MKSIAYLFLVLVLFSCGGNDNVIVGNKTSIEVEPVFDAGTVIKGEMITAKFVVTNTGEYPLIMGDVQGSCSCTVAEYPEDPIAPGDKGEIMAHINTDKTGTGPLSKRVSITANTDPSVTDLLIKANVIRK